MNQNGPKSPAKIDVCFIAPKSDVAIATFEFMNRRLENDAAVIRSM